MMPVIYTPTVGAACERFSEIYRRARGVFISYQNRHNLDDIPQNVPNQRESDCGHRWRAHSRPRHQGSAEWGSRSVNCRCTPPAAASARLTPCLSCWTSEQTTSSCSTIRCIRAGAIHVHDDEYYQFVDDVIQAIKARWPDVLLQFEDFAQKNAMPLLNRYRNEICSFNDDIQGTAAVTVGTLIAASRGAGSQLSEQKSSFSARVRPAAVSLNRLSPRSSAKDSVKKRPASACLWLTASAC